MKIDRFQEAYNRAFTKDLAQHLTEFNANHGPDGRFTSASGATSSVSAGHGERSHRYTAKDLIGGAGQVRKVTGKGGHRRAAGGMLAGRTAKTGPGGADPTDAVHTKGTFGDRGSVRLNQHAIGVLKDGRKTKQRYHSSLAQNIQMNRRGRMNAKRSGDPHGEEWSNEARSGYRSQHGKRIARTQAKATAGAAALSRPNISTKGGYPFAKVARFRPRGRK